MTKVKVTPGYGPVIRRDGTSVTLRLRSPEMSRKGALELAYHDGVPRGASMRIRMLRRSQFYAVRFLAMCVFTGSLSGPLFAQTSETVDTRREEIRTLRKQLTAISARLEKLEAEDNAAPESTSSSSG